jgi:hypothetical protein
MRRRDFITLFSGTAAWPLVARAQQKPVMGLLHSASAAAFKDRIRGLHQGLGEAGFFEDRNVVIDARKADSLCSL